MSGAEEQLHWFRRFIKSGHSEDLHLALKSLFQIEDPSEFAKLLRSIENLVVISPVFKDWESVFAGQLLNRAADIRLACLRVMTLAFELNVSHDKDQFVLMIRSALEEGSEEALLCALRVLHKGPGLPSRELSQKLLDLSLSHHSAKIRATLATTLRDFKHTTTTENLKVLACDFDPRTRANAVLSGAALFYRKAGDSEILKKMIQNASHDYHNRVIADSAMAHSLFDRDKSDRLIVDLLTSTEDSSIKSGEYAAKHVNPKLLKPKAS